MSLSHSPSVVTNGLVLYTDMSNTKKSWKGAPTTNYVANAAAMSGWNNYSNTANGTPAQFVTDLGTTGYRMDNVGSWNGVYKSVTVPAIGTYTFSAWIKWIDGSANVTGGAVYISGWGGGDSASATNRTLPGQWQRISITLNCTTTSMTFYLICWGGTNNADNSTWQVTMPQIEAGSYATPFVDGTRSNTQAILDLTNNVTITATSLTYAADNTFSFNGSSDYITVPSNQLALTSWTQPWTLGVWMYVPASATWSDGVNRSHFVSKGATAGSWGIIRGTTNNTIYAAIRTDAGIYQATGGSITRDAWCNVVGTWDGISAVRTYINGVLVGSSTAAILSGVPDTSNLFVGRSANSVAGSPGLFYNGKVSNVVGYTRALSAAEVAQNFNASRSRYGM